MYSYAPENIVALATPPGLGALAIIRLSGFDLSSTYRSFSHKNPIDRRAVFSNIYHPKSNKLLDEAVITYFKAPNSFTGEDVVEISCHGGLMVPHSIIIAAIDNGARKANPGEFSFRAFLNGKLDLLQAEGISSLISSKSQLSTDVSLYHLRGRVSDSLSEIKSDALNILSIIENELNFSEDEINLTSYSELLKKMIKIQSKVNSITKATAFGKQLLSGFRIVILGRPNSGKSSLYNAILGFDKAIVSNLPGTTRDTVESYFELKGVPICLIDTAGVWESDDFLNTLGIQKTMEALEQADLCLLVDDDDPSSLLNANISSKLNEHYILIKSKCDNLDLAVSGHDNIISISSKNGIGIDSLLTYLSTYISNRVDTSIVLDRILVTQRQRKLLQSSLYSINDIIEQLRSNVQADIIASSLRGFVISIKDVIGEIPNRDVLNHIFSNFCVGK